MAKFITLETADATRGKFLFNTEQIFMVVPGDETGGGADIATECTIFHTAATDLLSSYVNLKTAGGTNNTGTDVANQINAAIIANPGGQHASVKLLDGMSITDTVIK